MSSGAVARPDHAHRVLVVEDNGNARESLVLLLQVEGFEAEGVENGREALYGTIGYIVGLDDVEGAEALLGEVYAWQTQDRFVYRHVWEPDMLLMWDNRSVLHRATGGYEGHARRLHRTTIGERLAA